MHMRFVGFATLALALAACGDDDGAVPMDSGMGGTDSGGGGTDSGGGGTDSGGGLDAGGGTDAGMGTDAGGDPDAGSPTARPITFMETCPDFTACGGDLTGTWRYDGVCVTHAEVEAELQGACPTASFISGTGSIDGTVSFDGTNVMRDSTTTLSLVANIPMACTMGLACSLVDGVIMGMTMVDSVTCVDAAMGTGCDCTITDTETISENDPYTVTGTFFENTTTTRRWDYCVDGMDLTVREITAGDGDDPIEPGIQSFVME